MKINQKMFNRLSRASSTSIRRFSHVHLTQNDLDILKGLEFYGTKKQTPVSLKALVETGKGARLEYVGSSPEKHTLRDKILIQVACFLHRELPVRLAHRSCELDASPLFLRSTNIRQVSMMYKKSFADLRQVPAPSTPEKEAAFAKVIRSIYERHSTLLLTMAKGAHELRTFLNHDNNTFAENSDIHKRLDDFYMSRIGIRMLIGQYLALRDTAPSDPSSSHSPHSSLSFPIPSPSSHSPSSMVGLISETASPRDLALQAIEDAAYMCTRTHGDAPEVTIHGRTDLTFPYVPSHISYILLELLKNSMRATMETHGGDKTPPPIRLVIADGVDNEDVVIKISDEGGGIRRSNMNRIFSYLFTTAPPSVLEGMLNTDGEGVKDFDTSSPLAGLGYGLPLARNYARYFGGELTIMSMEGYGTDGFIYLPRLNNKAPLL